MFRSRAIVLLIGLLAISGMAAPGPDAGTRKPGRSPVARIPRTWDDAAVASLELPNAAFGASPAHLPARWYYALPVMKIYQGYPVYAPGREPAGYMKWLKRQKPRVIFDPATLKTEADWVKAGEIVFDAPHAYGPPSLAAPDAVFCRKAGVPVARDGTLPFFQYVIRRKGQVEFGSFACAMCHTRVMPDGTLLKGAQGNLPFDAYFASLVQKTARSVKQVRLIYHQLYGAPWIKPDPMARIDRLPAEEILAQAKAIPAGVSARHGTSLFAPVQVPSLIGVKDYRYLDHTGLMRQRSIGDLMRYAAFNQGLDFADRFGSFTPVTPDLKSFPKTPAELAKVTAPRYSDAQLYAVARYLYALRPPRNPHQPDTVTARGKSVFEREGCGTCHTPPLYTNNRLTPAEGFAVPEAHSRQYDILPVCVGTDPTLALRTRRGTGYYKVPSLRGVWYRGMFGHDGACATLEDWFDPRRVRDDYIPTGSKGAGTKTRAVKGHPFGLSLSPEDRRALIAFLQTL
jgi:hypothetical protein